MCVCGGGSYDKKKTLVKRAVSTSGILLKDEPFGKTWGLLFIQDSAACAPGTNCNMYSVFHHWLA
jgi:hypothetical protein